MPGASLLVMVPTFVLVFFRTCSMMLAAPLFGSSRVPNRLKVLMALVLASGITAGLQPATLPSSMWLLAVGIGGEIIFGAALGLGLSLTFSAVNWAGEVIGQQLGFNMAETVDPQFGGSSSVVGDVYFMLSMCIFLFIGGHRSLIISLRSSFQYLPVLSVGMSGRLLAMFLGLLKSAMVMGMQMAAPLLVTMLILDVALGFVGKTIPQFNVNAASTSARTLVGMMILTFGVAMTSGTIRASMGDALQTVQRAWVGWH